MTRGADHGPVAVLLAAGEGRRFGGITQLADLSGQPMCRRVADQLLSLGLPLTVVTGAYADAVERALEAARDVAVRASPERIAPSSSSAGTPERMVTASFGPIPFTVIRRSKISFSPRVKNPNSASVSSRTCVNVCREICSPGFPS